MNKKLLTAIVGAALVAGPAVASAGATVYGNVHASFDNADNGGDATGGTTDLPSGTKIPTAGTNTATGTKTKRSYVSSNDSYFGVKGDEDLGGGFKAIYQIQSVFSLSTGLSLDTKNGSG